MVEKASRDSVLERTEVAKRLLLGLLLSFLQPRQVTGPSWACFFVQQMESVKLSNTWVIITFTVSGTAPGTHLLSHIILSLQSQIRNAGGDRAVRKRDTYVTLKYHTLTLIHSIRLFVKYACSTVPVSLCLSISVPVSLYLSLCPYLCVVTHLWLILMSQCLVGCDIQPVTKMLCIYGRKKVQNLFKWTSQRHTLYILRALGLEDRTECAIWFRQSAFFSCINLPIFISKQVSYSINLYFISTIISSATKCSSAF